MKKSPTQSPLFRGRPLVGTLACPTDPRSRHWHSRCNRQPTDAEKRLWTHLRKRQLRGLRFRRQQPIGPYIVDFCCVAPKLVIEVDGGQHDSRAHDDAVRTQFLQRSGYRVVRFWNNEVLQNLPGVLTQIDKEFIALRQRQGTGGKRREE